METRRIGSLEVSVLGLGCNDFGLTLDEAQATRIVHGAVDAGVTYFDTAEAYGGGQSEQFLGRALGSRRERVVIATKFGARGSGEDGLSPGDPAWVRVAVERNLVRLGVDCIDHYQLHYFDPDTPLEDTLGALERAGGRAGKVRELGCSNFSAEQLLAAFEITEREGLGAVPHRPEPLQRHHPHTRDRRHAGRVRRHRYGAGAVLPAWSSAC